MNNKIIKINLFEVAVIALGVRFILTSSSLIKLTKYTDVALLTLFLCAILWKLMLQTYTVKSFVIFITFGAICAYTCLKADYYYIIFSYLCIIGMQGVNLKEVVYKTSMIKAVILLLHVTISLAMATVASEGITYTYRNGVKRMNFLMGHPNTFSMYVLWTTLEYVYARYEKLTISHLIMVWMINFTAYLFTNSNTSILVSTIFVFLLIMDKSGRRVKRMNAYAKYAFSTCSLLFPLLSVIYTKLPGSFVDFYHKLNTLFTGRLLYGAYAYDHYGFTILGRLVKYPSKSVWRGIWFDDIYFDNSYIWLFVSYGAVYLIILSITFILMSKRADYIEKALIIALSVYGIMEGYVINAALCFPLLIIGKYIYSDRKVKELNVQKSKQLTINIAEYS